MKELDNETYHKIMEKIDFEVMIEKEKYFIYLAESALETIIKNAIEVGIAIERQRK